MEHFALLALTSILFIVNPIAVIPTYLVITQKETSTQGPRPHAVRASPRRASSLRSPSRAAKSSISSASRSTRFASPVG